MSRVFGLRLRPSRVVWKPSIRPPAFGFGSDSGGLGVETHSCSLVLDCYAAWSKPG